MHRNSAQREVARTRGLTLIELIVTMSILVILAGLVLPKLDVFKLKANKAQAASVMFDVNSYVSAFRAQHDVYPDVWDSLLDSATPTQFYSKLHPEITGAPPNLTQKFALTTLTADEVKSLARVGITQVVDHDAAAEIPNDSDDFATLRTFAAGDTVATLNLASANPGDVEEAKAIAADFYPELSGQAGTASVPAGKKVVALGLGRFNSIKGDLMHTIPFYANADQTTQYTRFLVLFEVDDGGSRAKLLGTVGADGDRLEGEIVDFYGS